MEVWKPIPQLPGYFASSEGRIRGKYNLIMKPRKASLIAYHKIGIVYEGRQRPFRVSRLVAAAWHGLDLFDETMEVHHRDEVKSNNRPDNLQVMTSFDHKELHG